LFKKYTTLETMQRQNGLAGANLYTVMALQIMKLILNDIFIALGKGR
jgi:hypothetical protein